MKTVIKLDRIISAVINNGQIKITFDNGEKLEVYSDDENYLKIKKHLEGWF